MRAELGLPSVRGDDEKGGGMMGGFGGSMGGVGAGGKAKRPISVKFEIPYFTTSGIQVRYLKIIEPKVSRRDEWLYNLTKTNTDLLTASIPVSALGAIHHTEWRHCGAFAGCAVMPGLDELETTICYRNGLLFLLSMAMAYWRVGESSEYLRGHDDSAPGAVVTETRLETADMIGSVFVSSSVSRAGQGVILTWSVSILLLMSECSTAIGSMKLVRCALSLQTRFMSFRKGAISME